MNKLQKEIKSYQENMKEDEDYINIFSFIGWLSGSKTITKKEAEYLMWLANKD